jgi:hypothetical protein
MRKLLMLVVVALAALAVSAPSAAANADFPHDDTDAESWVAATAIVFGAIPCDGSSACEFEGWGDGPWAWEYGTTSPRLGDYCSSVELAGEIDHTGTLLLSDVDWGRWNMSTFCDLMVVDQLPWTGQVCMHVPTGEMWVRQGMALETTWGTGQTSGAAFGEFTDNSGSGSMTLEFGDPEFVDTGMGGVNDFELSATSVLDFSGNNVELYPSGGDPQGLVSAAPCGWPELS